MLQVDLIYEFFQENIFNKHFTIYYPNNGIVPPNNNLNGRDFRIFTKKEDQHKIFFVDQEPLIPNIIENYIDFFKFPSGIDLEELYKKILAGGNLLNDPAVGMTYEEHLENLANPNQVYKEPHIFVTSEISDHLQALAKKYDMHVLYYFFHGFAALDWYRGYYAINYNKLIVKPYDYDFISFNRIINNDRSYRIYFVSLLKESGLLEKGLVSFNVTDNLFDGWRDETADPDSKLSEYAKQHAEKNLVNVDKLVIDSEKLPGTASANILRNINRYLPTGDIPINVDTFWHVVTETVFYYDKLHLTEKIFKPIANKQPFMLLAAPGNLKYLRSYGFKTFDGIIDESYDLIQDNDSRIEAVVKQLQWYCNLSSDEKNNVIQQLAPIIEYNFHHFYGEFRHIIARELLDNTKSLFLSIGHDDSHINYESILKILTH